MRHEALIAFHDLKAAKSRASGRTGGAPAENLWRPDVKALVTGWFSFEQMGASAGDLLARDVACKWLRDAGRETRQRASVAEREGVWGAGQRAGRDGPGAKERGAGAAHGPGGGGGEDPAAGGAPRRAGGVRGGRGGGPGGGEDDGSAGPP